MQESVLKALALACSLLGLALMFYAASSMQAYTSICSISIDDADLAVRICGNITSTYVKNGHIFLTLRNQSGNQSCGIKFVIFNSSAAKLNQSGMSPYSLSRGMRICTRALVQEYPKASGRVEAIYQSGDIEVRRA